MKKKKECRTKKKRSFKKRSSIKKYRTKKIQRGGNAVGDFFKKALAPFYNW